MCARENARVYVICRCTELQFAAACNAAVNTGRAARVFRCTLCIPMLLAACSSQHGSCACVSLSARARVWVWVCVRARARVCFGVFLAAGLGLHGALRRTARLGNPRCGRRASH